MWRNDTKCKCRFMFSLKNLARKGLSYNSSTAAPHTWPVLLIRIYIAVTTCARIISFKRYSHYFCMEEPWEHVSVHWQLGNYQLWANCFMCWNHLPNLIYRELNEMIGILFYTLQTLIPKNFPNCRVVPRTSREPFEYRLEIDEINIRPYQLRNDIFFTGKTVSLYWNRPRVSNRNRSGRGQHKIWLTVTTGVQHQGPDSI